MSDVTTPNTNPEMPDAPETPMTRDELRAAIFNARPAHELVKNFLGGVTVEIRQPSLKVILETREGDNKSQTARMLIDYTYVPNTDVKVFEAADVDALMEAPFGPEMKGFLDAMNKILGIDGKAIEEGVKDATKST